MHQQYFDFIDSLNKQDLSVLDKSISKRHYVPIDLSTDNGALLTIKTEDSSEFGLYIDQFLEEKAAKVCYGGYLEQRNIYQRSAYFKPVKDAAKERNIHLGLDFWAKAGTAVIAPFNGKVHSFQNNTNYGDYGPTIILAHQSNDFTFYTLYGHLSLEYLDQLEVGQEIAKDQIIGELGRAEVNGDYPPHLHFQVILDLEGSTGDYSGVCSRNKLDFYRGNCPDPKMLLGL
ncbi:MAG: murein DD-endopeptidase MepM/ murein hydrolase activator NlpD [Crocinitomix sp.]|jgi:murein DD-endopeptidase MepM/ murein hydrolase activator NlpD